MTSKDNGASSKPNITQRKLVLRILVAILLSNLFFYLLFLSSGDSEAEVIPVTGIVQIQMTGELRTPFQMGKKVLLVDRHRGLSIEAVLESPPSETDSHFTVSVKEESAAEVLKVRNWEIIPYLKHLTLSRVGKRVEHEIRY